ncbi:MAG: hypothetical protein K2M94_00185 [Paramuribaculum sp.]|nr:hypothetical protein [Paramuribaculum sp.]
MPKTHITSHSSGPVDRKHDAHVAYETSGNIAVVSDEAMEAFVRYHPIKD